MACCRLCQDIILDKILATFSPEMRESTSMRTLIALTQTFGEQFEITKQQLTTTQAQLQTAQAQLQTAQAQLQTVQEQLTKSQEKIKDLEEELRRLVKKKYFG